MIKLINIKNYILIDELTLEFDKGFNVFTGETGAGKSIIIGAIDAVLGAKTGKEVIKTNSDRAYIELLVELNEDFDKSIFTQNGIDINGNELIISKEITPSSTRSRINGIIVTLDFIKDIREKLLDIHTQHQNYNYIQQKNHIILLDNFALKPHRDNITIYKEKYHRFQTLQKKLADLKNLFQSAEQQKDFLKFQIQEIENASVEDIQECEKLEKELDILSNIEKLKELSFSSYWTLYGDDNNIISALGNIKSNLSKLSQLDETTVSIEEEFINTYEIIKDLASRLRDYAESKENDEERMDFIQERLSLLDRIKRKYGNTLEDVLKTYEELSSELETIESSSDETLRIELEIKELNDELTVLAHTISSARKELAKVLSQAVTAEMEKLELPKSRFEINIEQIPISDNGIDRVEFLISTNISEPLKPLAKTASGGEISRIMLAIKTIFAKADSTNTVIFDEIDTGISGKASQAVADEIVSLAKSHQIILITHQPIIAAKAAKHFYVKKQQDVTTKVTVYNLKDDNRIKAIALLAAGEINDESTSFAKNLLGVH